MTKRHGLIQRPLTSEPDLERRRALLARLGDRASVSENAPMCCLAELGPRARTVLIVSADSCLLGALGLILPGVTGILPWLTPLAAALLAALTARGILFHRHCREEASDVPSLVLLALALFVAVGRWSLAPL